VSIDRSVHVAQRDGNNLNLISQHDSVKSALDHLGEGNDGEGTFDIITINRVGVKVASRQAFDLDEGTPTTRRTRTAGNGTATDDLGTATE
jgi:hypothetical protein